MGLIQQNKGENQANIDLMKLEIVNSNFNSVTIEGQLWPKAERMNDFKVMLNRPQEQYLSRLLPKGYSFQLFKVRKNMSNYQYKEFDKKSKKNEPFLPNNKESFVLESIEQSERSIRERSEPILSREPLKKIQEDLLGLVRKLRKHESSYPFRSPVDPKALQIPDYFNVVLEPIDLKTIEDKIRRDEYEHVGEFQRDIYKMIMNSYKYNQKASTTEKKTIQFQQFYVQTMKEFHRTKTDQGSEDKQIVKEEMVDEKKDEEMPKEAEVQKIQTPKQTLPSVNLFIPAQPANKKPKQNSKLFDIVYEIANERPRQSKKQLPKPQSASHIPKIKSPKKIQRQVKKQQPEDDMSLFSQPQPEMTFSQQIEPTHQKDMESEQIKEEMKSNLDNETQNNKQINFSEGYNEAALGGKIKNTEVQKQITSLLKRLSEFPLTKHKKNKNFSKFSNLQQSMTQADKKKLFDRIVKLDENDIQWVVRILTKGKWDTSKQDQFQIDLDKADSKVLREVQNFIALRDQSFASSQVVQNNGSMPLSFGIRQIISEAPKIDKKVKKEEKKNVKKKTNRKNSNDDSFSLNPPPIKKKKSQKPSRKNLKNEEKSQLNGDDQQSFIDPKEQSSSYHPEPIHHQYHGKTQIQHFHHKSQQVEKVTQVVQKESNEQKIKTVEPKKQREMTPRLIAHEDHRVYNSPHPQQQEENGMYDIDQFLVSSRNYENEAHEEIVNPEYLPFNRLRQPSNSLEQLDLMDFNNIMRNSSARYLMDDEIKDFTIYQHQKEQNDEDHFF